MQQAILDWILDQKIFFSFAIKDIREQLVKSE